MTSPMLPQTTNDVPRRRVFSVGNLYRFQFSSTARLMDSLFDCVNDVLEKVVLVIGPLLILLALGIVSLLVHTFATIIVPMMRLKYKDSMIIIGLHVIWVGFIVINVLFNYAMCVLTRNTGPNNDKVVREMAYEANLVYPETPVQMSMYKDDFEHKMITRIRRRRERQEQEQRATESVSPGGSNGMTQRRNKTSTSNNTSQEPLPPIRQWMLMGPHEWGYCANSHQPKPPRSHYDHVTKSLVLNLDHYCPWMFNAIGYFNYRYFVNFMMYVLVGMLYGAYISYEPFSLMHTEEYRAFIRKERALDARLERPVPMMPYREEKMEISLSFMLCLAVGVALILLGGFHIYLTLTAQTTIEFHGNWGNRRKLKKMGKTFVNPYDQGWRKNWQQIYGSSSYCWLTAMLPSFAEPEYLPAPIPGKNNKRRVDRKGHDYDNDDTENDIEQQTLMKERIVI